MTRPVPALCVTFVAGAEACRLVPYQDSRGVWTNGYGNTTGVVPGQAITQEDANKALAVDLSIAAQRLAGRVSDAVLQSLSDHQYSALISFVFNVGADPAWTIWKVLNGKGLDQVPMQLMRFDKIKKDGQVITLPGLVHRRAAEVTLWNTADVTAAVAVAQAASEPPPPSSETRAAVTPPTPMGKPLTQSKSMFASGATAVLAVATPLVGQSQQGLTAVRDTLAPYVGDSQVLQHLQTELTMALAAAAVIALVLTYLKNKVSKT